MKNNSLLDKIKKMVYYILGVLLFLLIIGVVCINYVTLGGRKYDRSADTLVVTDSDFAKYDDYSFLNEFSRLKTLDLSSLDVSKKTIDQISSDLKKDVNIIWSVKIGGKRYGSETEELTVPAENLGDAALFSVFHHLKNFEIVGSVPIDELNEVVQLIRQNNPGVHCVYSTELYGVPVDSSTEYVCLDNIRIKKLDTLRTAISLFPNIKSYDMCDCGVSDDEMGKLREEYPDVKFKWMLHILKYDIPTDVQVFSTLVGNWVAYADEKTFSPLFRYCTDLRALDLGHWDYISDISEMRNLKNLEILIITDNSISDLSPLSELTHLKYMDLRYNKITDVSPLTSLQELQFLEIGGNKVKNWERLCECRSLKYLFIQDAVVPTRTVEIIEKEKPEGCVFKMKNTRGHPWYGRIIKMFRRWDKVAVYHDWKHVEYKKS